MRIIVAAVALLMLSACGENGEQHPPETKGNPSVTPDSYSWKLVTTWPAKFPIFQDGVARFSELVEKLSNGRLKIDVYAGGELVPPLEVFDAVSRGAAQMGHGASFYWVGKVPSAQLFTTIPFGLDAQGMNAWMYSGGGLQLWRELYGQHNLVPFPMGNTGAQMGGWFNKKIDSISDIKGLRMRIPGVAGEVITRLGGSAVLLPGSEVFLALQSGAIDATEWAGPFHDRSLGFHKISRYYYGGWHEPGAMLELIINKDAFDSLPEDLKLIVSTASESVNAWMLSEFEKHNSQALEDLLAKEGIEILVLPEEVTKRLRSETELVLAERSESDEEFKKVLVSYMSFKKSYGLWKSYSSPDMQ